MRRIGRDVDRGDLKQMLLEAEFGLLGKSVRIGAKGAEEITNFAMGWIVPKRRLRK
jgi:hypothetical protein